MKNYYRNPVVEEGIHNIIMQNRCGNRMTILVHMEKTELEFIYKPNAFRRKEYEARNFSNRDNQTELFSTFELPDIRQDVIRDITYDPFITRLHVISPSSAKNVISFINFPDMNAFAISADRPLTIGFRPRTSFVVEDGLVLEHFHDRGEDIVSFISFPGYDANRFRVRDDGLHVIQITENDCVIIGGEENKTLAIRELRKYEGKSIRQIEDGVESKLFPHLRKGRPLWNDQMWQDVLELNRRAIWSGMDAGGACFGAINRIYYLIWNRDGSQTSTMAARAGNLDLLKIWTPFILRNPSIRKDIKGKPVAEWLQILGTRWTKSEDDGIYYAFLSIFSLVFMTGERDLLYSSDFTRLLDSLDHVISTRFSEAEGLFCSDTRGECTLASSPMFGYDSVNGVRYDGKDDSEALGSIFNKSYGLYHNINMYNALRMAVSLVAEVPGSISEPDMKRRVRWLEISCIVSETLSNKYVDQESGCYFADYEEMADGTMRFIRFTDRNPEPDYWEYAWAVSTGPFFPDINLSLRSAEMVRIEWPKIRSYGYCPWNTLALLLREFERVDSPSLREMLSDEISDAIIESVKYPMKKALTEYKGETEGWRPLPFSAGSFLQLSSSLLLQSLPRGIAIRASSLVDKIENFCWHNAEISVEATGDGEFIKDWSINGEKAAATLQIPENLVRHGRNSIRINRDVKPVSKPLLYSSSATLLSVDSNEECTVFKFFSPIPCDLVFISMGSCNFTVTDSRDKKLQLSRVEIECTAFTNIRVVAAGNFAMSLKYIR